MYNSLACMTRFCKTGYWRKERVESVLHRVWKCTGRRYGRVEEQAVSVELRLHVLAQALRNVSWCGGGGGRFTIVVLHELKPMCMRNCFRDWFLSPPFVKKCREPAVHQYTSDRSMCVPFTMNTQTTITLRSTAQLRGRKKNPEHRSNLANVVHHTFAQWRTLSRHPSLYWFEPVCIDSTSSSIPCKRSKFQATVFIYFSNTVPLHSLKHNSQRLNQRNRGLVLVTSWAKELILIKICRATVEPRTRALIISVHVN